MTSFSRCFRLSRGLDDNTVRKHGGEQSLKKIHGNSVRRMKTARLTAEERRSRFERFSFVRKRRFIDEGGKGWGLETDVIIFETAYVVSVSKFRSKTVIPMRERYIIGSKRQYNNT